MEIDYFDLKLEQDPIFENSSTVDAGELIERSRQENAEVFNENDFLEKGQSIEDIPGSALHRHSEEWKKAMDTIIFSLSGQVPTERESSLNFSAAHDLRTYFKNTEYADTVESQEFAFGTLPYLFSGFSVKDRKWSGNGINSTENFIATVDHFLREDNIDITSFLCAHKKRRENEVHSLTENIDSDRKNQAFNLLNGIASNSPVSNVNVDLYQPTSSKEGLLSIYPGIVLKTAERGNLDEIASILDYQMDEMEEACNQHSGNGVQYSISSVDDQIREVYDEVEDRLGEDFRLVSTDELDQLAEEDHFYQIARDSTMPNVERLMPYFKEPGSTESVIEEDDISDIEDSELRDALKYYTEPMSKASKAIIETMFFYQWGQRTKEDESLAIGLDRDHEEFQNRAFQYGFGGNYHMAHHAPILYGRRTDNDEMGGSLSSSSFRQFWR